MTTREASSMSVDTSAFHRTRDGAGCHAPLHEQEEHDDQDRHHVEPTMIAPLSVLELTCLNDRSHTDSVRFSGGWRRARRRAAPAGEADLSSARL
jgi:hypothetical protein